jgi:nitrite reductase/ring-hydroxylating ferredoxin subunit
MAWTTLCEQTELTEGRGLYVEVDGFRVAVFLNAGQPHAIDNTCPHANGSLAEGFIEDGCAVCPLHYWAFRLDNGEMRDMPGVAITVYPTRLHAFNGKTLVQANLPMA